MSDETPEFRRKVQHRMKQRIVGWFNDFKAKAEAQGIPFDYTVKEYAEVHGWEWEDGPPSPTDGMPNLKLYPENESAPKDSEPESVPEESQPSPQEPSDAPAENISNEGESEVTGGIVSEAAALNLAPRPPFQIGIMRSDTSMANSPSTNSHPDWGTNIDWYKTTTVDRRRLPAESVQLQQIRKPIHDVKNPNKAHLRIELWTKIRQLLHQYRHFDVDAKIVKGSKLMDSVSGLPALFLAGGAEGVPFDIAADAKELATRWRREDFDGHIFRGLMFPKKSTMKLSDKAIKMRPDQAGERHLVNGQWFANWLCALRDGAHGSAQAGIYGKAEFGAFSVIMAGQYDDVDNLDTVEYCGVLPAKDAREPATTTALLLQNVGRPDRPVRLLRSSNFAKSKFAPAKGLRYDGLYAVTEAECTDEEKRAYTFQMQRVPGQDPIRWQGEERRPTDEEMAALEQHHINLQGERKA